MLDPTHSSPAAVPCLLYGNPAAAADWISEVLGFREASGCDGRCSSAVGDVEMERDGAMLVLGRSDSRSRITSSHTRVLVDDVDDACLRALCAGGAIERPPTQRLSGVRQAVVSDPEGNRWELAHQGT